jgi:hypothetical protein
MELHTLFLHFAATCGFVVFPFTQIQSNGVVPEFAAPDVSHVASVEIESQSVFISWHFVVDSPSTHIHFRGIDVSSDDEH